MAELEAMVLVGMFIIFGRKMGNSVKALEAAKSCKTIELAAIMEKD